MERLSPRATVSGNESVSGAASNACLDGGNASSHSTNGIKPVILCEDQGHESVRHIQHQSVLCWDEGCDRQAEAGPMSRDGEIDLFCSNHQSSDVIATRAQHCQFTGCLNTPKYGQRKGPLKFCPQHKRAGMHINRNGQLLLATRDGSAFKDEEGTEMVGTDHDTTVFGRPGGEPNAPNEGNSLVSSGEAGLQGSAESVSLGPGRAQDKTTFPNVSVMVATPQFRKTCEVTGCRIQPSYGPSGTSRPQFCASHKKEGMVGLKNRPCIFPGCNTRPHYGLLGCRPIYCAKHKEANMVHLLKEATTREKVEMTRNLGETIRTPPEPIRPESKRLFSATRPKEEKLRHKVPKKNVATFQVRDHQELGRKKGTDSASPLPLQPPRQQPKQNEEGAGKGGTYCPRKTASSMPSAPSSSTSTSTPASSNKSAARSQVISPIETEDLGKCGNASGAPPPLPVKVSSSRVVDTLGMTPSFELQVLKDIRESAQAEATKSGSGRRARVPSRKALEASGKLKIEGIQWLTKEKKEEEVRRMREFRAQRKAVAAVGLRVGHVIEAAAIGPTIGRKSAGTDGSDMGDVAKAEPTKMIWRKLSPAEILEVAARKSIMKVFDKARPGGRGQVKSGAGAEDNDMQEDKAKDAIAGLFGKKRKETVWALQGTAGATTPKSGTAFTQDAKRRKESYGDQSVQPRQAMPSSDRNETHKGPSWGSTGKYTGVIIAGEVGGMKMCQFEDCARKATFGVNSTVRYCKLHALFGMHRIIAPM